MTYTVEVGEALEVLREMPDGVFQCCVTSPPYWGLRDYGVDGQIGLEKTPSEYVERMVGIFREVRRTLRDDGVLWLNLGDGYAQGGRGGDTGKSTMAGTTQHQDESKKIDRRKTVEGLKPKDLVGIPWAVAFALRADGWYLRSDVIWHKPNPMPESTRGRPTKSHEYVFLLSKSRDYYFDDEAIAEDATMKPRARPNGRKSRQAPGQPPQTYSTSARTEPAVDGSPDGKRHVRSVWTIATTPYKEAHFAVMSGELARRCVASGTGLQGCCGACGAPRRRILQRTKAVIRRTERNAAKIEQGLVTTCHGTMLSPPKMETLGWEPSCGCGAADQPCLVLDPFNGAGTTGLAALEHGSDYVGIELNPEYAEMARRRIDAALAEAQ